MRDYYATGFGAVVTCTLATYVYVLLDERPLRSALSATDSVKQEPLDQLVRETLAARGGWPGQAPVVLNQVPQGSGLGGSSATVVGLLHALEHAAVHAGPAGRIATPLVPTIDQAMKLAAEACAVEIGRLGGNVGKLDQYSTAVGGLLHIRFAADESVDCRRILVHQGTLAKLEQSLLLFHTGGTHQASAVMAGWRREIPNRQAALNRMRDQAAEVSAALAVGDVQALGPALDEAWHLKRTMASGVTDARIDTLYEAAMTAGATGGKLCGAGGGGFLLVFSPPERAAAVRSALADCPELPVRLTTEGTAIVYNDGPGAADYR